MWRALAAVAVCLLSSATASAEDLVSVSPNPATIFLRPTDTPRCPPAGTRGIYFDASLGTIQAISPACVIVDLESGGGGGAPTTALYWVGAPDAGLSAEKDLSALATGLVINTAGVPSAYTGAACTNQVIEDLSAVGAPTCTTITSAYTSGTFPPATHVLLAHGDAAIASPTRGAVITGQTVSPIWTKLDLNTNVGRYLRSDGTDLLYSSVAAAGAGACGANTFATTLTDNAAPTCSAIADGDVPNTITIDLATSASDLTCTNCIGPTEITDLALGTDTSGNYVQSVSTSVNAGVTGGAAGSEGTLITLNLNWGHTVASNPVFNAKECVASTDGTSGGGFVCEGTTANTNEQRHLFWPLDGADTEDFFVVTGTAPTADDQVVVSDSTGAATWRGVSDCDDTAGNHLNYDTATNTFSCGTSSGGGSAHNLLSATHSDTLPNTPMGGMLIVGNTSSQWAGMGAGGAGMFLSTNSTGDGLTWSSLALEAEVDFGAHPGSSIVTKTVTTGGGITAASKINCGLTMTATADRTEGAEDPIIEQMTLAVHTRAVNSFKITMAPAMGMAIGKYLVHCFVYSGV